jgi:uncharacterized protein YndB with AHSA1/START domain
MSTITTGLPENGSFHLIVRRTISAPAEQLFDFWTQPEHVRLWWGPENVTCSSVEIDLKIGGRYRIGNQLPDGEVVWISGHFEVINRPTELVYTWTVESIEKSLPEHVRIRFQSNSDGTTEVIVTHERIGTHETKKQHLQGWLGCLDGLTHFVSSASDHSSI